MRKWIIVGAAALAVAACERQAAQPPVDAGPTQTGATDQAGRLSGFRHDLSQDVSGYYMPATPAEVGTWRLRSISVLSQDDMDAWEGGQQGELYGPIMIEFDNVTSPTGVNELGQEYYSQTARVLPEAYDVTDTRVRFRGRSPEVGIVTLDAELDGDALGLARRDLGSSEGPVLTGTLTVGERVFEGQQFRWWMGD
ncbi:MAG: hypothetical protein ACK4FB_12995 [Brevundimonas sp.]|uniref:hypothetical protein n=1 Tax=Brevundimonas sp. TaxID=1871086 RepID=UPI00391CBE6E